MLKNLKKSNIFTLMLVAGISLGNKPLHAEWNAYNYAEVATALMRGVGSSVEHNLTVKKDESKSAHFKKMLISGLRVTHGLLAIANHKNDYPSCYLEGFVAVDAVQGLYHTTKLCKSLITGHDKKDSKVPDAAEELAIYSEDKSILLTSPFEAYIMPTLEALAALYLATSDDSLENTKLRFAIETILSVLRINQIASNMHDAPARKSLALASLALAAYSMYELRDGDSKLKTWIDGREELELEEAQQRRREEIRRWEEVYAAEIMQQREELRRFDAKFVAWRQQNPLNQQEAECRRQLHELAAAEGDGLVNVIERFLFNIDRNAYMNFADEQRRQQEARDREEAERQQQLYDDFLEDINPLLQTVVTEEVSDEN